MHLKTVWQGFRPSFYAMFKCSSKQILTKYDINIQSRENLALKSKRYTSSGSYIHSGDDSPFHEHMHATFLIAQWWHHSFSPQMLKGVWSLDCPSISSLHCLNSILHQLMNSVLVDHQGWMKLSSLHQLFETLNVVNDTVRTFIRTLLVGGLQIISSRQREQKNIWNCRLNTIGLASLPLPRRTPVERSHIWLAGLCRPSGCVGEGTNSGRIRGRKKKIKPNERLSHKKTQGL